MHIPSKTFLLGEYLVLRGGPALVLTSPPYFECNITASKQASTEGIHPESPAGKFINAHPGIFSELAIEFFDPHQQRGGFGASTAQFLAVYKAFHGEDIDPYALLDTYLEYAWDGQGLAPSGVDLMAQCYEGVTWIDKQQKQIENYGWPFDALRYDIIRTGNKIATHEHLQQLNDFPSQQLQAIMQQAYQAFTTSNASQFVECVKQYRQALNELDFIAPETAAILEELDQNPVVLAAKGCGALGADTILILSNA